MAKKNKIEFKSDKYPDKFYFDDCLICWATKAHYEKGEPMSIKELKKVFRKQNNKNNERKF